METPLESNNKGGIYSISFTASAAGNNKKKIIILSCHKRQKQDQQMRSPSLATSNHICPI